MIDDFPIFIIRLPSSDLDKSSNYFINNGFELICHEIDAKLMWFKKSSLIFCVMENVKENFSLVIYRHDLNDYLDKLSELGIIGVYSADENGKHFEAKFTDPAGFEISIADIEDLPENCRNADYTGLYEISLPASPYFADSVNFWHSLEFEPLADKPRPHPWARLAFGTLTIGLHQSTEWQRPSLFFSEKSPFNSEQEIFLNLRSGEKIRITKTIDNIYLYEFT